MKKRFLRIGEVAQMLGLSESAIRKKIAAMDDFPAPRKLGARAIGFLASEIEEWIEERERAVYR
ncbi:AlpA family phage regulatory protein [Desulfuromonas thiophila]|jgi:prophage regulatory protein|uniref:helix-turn-helix transcriptional regulator n=1 Tax=Desulfuromonas thiophila TaxID=57664 RepID=UPI0029F4A6CD|nr:AlpA family phage regulatory protein [Desulfuromonas thiophila]